MQSVHLGIKHTKLKLLCLQMDLSAPYWNTVFSPSLDDWSRGWTPNPDVMCNREIKFGELLRRLDQTALQTSVIDPTAFGRRQTKRWLVTGEICGDTD